MSPWYFRASVWAMLAIPGSFLFASCQRAGLTEAPTSGPRSGPIEAVSPPAGERGGHATINGVRDNGTEVRVEGLDVILHSPAGRDPRFREQVAFWTDFWTVRQADYFVRYLDRMGNYESFVDEELERRGLPTSLRYLPIVESGYHPTIVSRAGATGLWQIMAPTARDLGLTVSSVVDDRRDPFAATHAALDYLEQLHNRFDSWFLALAAYNAGPGRVSQILNQYGSGRVDVVGDALFLEIRAHLPAETREFVPRFFAAADLAQRYSDALIPEPITFDEVVVPDATSFDVVAAAAGVPENEILALNPHFLRGFTPIGEVRVVRVPAGAGGEFEENYARIPPEERLAFLEHIVAAGETLSHIARRYGIPVSDLIGANTQVDPRRLQIGAPLIVPVGTRRSETTIASASAGGPPSLSSGAAVGGAAESHLVSSGESLWTIARSYGVTTEALAAANQRSAQDVIRVGEELRIP